MKKVKKNIGLLTSALLSTGLYAQTNTIQVGESEIDSSKYALHTDVGMFPKKPEDVLYNFKVGGSYRFFSTFNVQKKDYILNETINDTALSRNLFIGDDSQLPNLTLNFSGRPSKRTAWGFDLYAFQFLDGKLNQTYGTGQVGLNNKPSVFNPLGGTRLASNLGLLLGINLYGDFETDYGVFSVKTGGIHWVSLSDLTLAGFTGYNRFMLFERNPWDPINRKAIDRYQSFFGQGNINQDTRWGEKAFVGTILEASKLPADMSMKFLYGKTELNGGFLTIPNLSVGGQLKLPTKKGFIGVNSFNNQTYTDSLNTEGIGFNIVTGQVYTQLAKGFQLKSEFGAGRYYSPSHDLPWGEAINIKLNLTKEAVKIPTEVHLFRISENVINNNSIFWNSAINEASNNSIPAGSVGSSALLSPFASALTPVGQFTNNRQGININSEFEVNDFKISVANGISSELKGLSNTISYGHPVNQLTRSRFWRWNFPTQVGPYQRYNVIYRDVYETVEVLDTSVAKKFNVMELQMKYHGKFMLRDFYVFLLNRYSSVQDFVSPITVFSEKAYLRHYSNELEMYYSLNKKMVLTSYLGYERIFANYRTTTDLITKRPRNQEGWGIGLGVDYDLSKNTALFIRRRWYNFKDKSFQKDVFKGTETTVELKLSF
jgi:hypothetical protein